MGEIDQEEYYDPAIKGIKNKNKKVKLVYIMKTDKLMLKWGKRDQRGREKKQLSWGKENGVSIDIK
ncbi:MAG: hypothetical protein IPN87_06200 [Saprospiraceae bacterium]|nr:hypothetical protein [Candidatus Brachybacter algidus]